LEEKYLPLILFSFELKSNFPLGLVSQIYQLKSVPLDHRNQQLVLFHHDEPFGYLMAKVISMKGFIILGEMGDGSGN